MISKKMYTKGVHKRIIKEKIKLDNRWKCGGTFIFVLIASHLTQCFINCRFTILLLSCMYSSSWVAKNLCTEDDSKRRVDKTGDTKRWCEKAYKYLSPSHRAFSTQFFCYYYCYSSLFLLLLNELFWNHHSYIFSRPSCFTSHLFL